MNRKVFWGYAHGQADAWEAICVDLDLAVQGVSFDEVRGLLNEAVATYAEDARRERPDQARRLLARRAPVWVQLKFAAMFLAHIGLRGSDRRELQAGFDIPCPA